jgi:hypothetical protein
VIPFKVNGIQQNFHIDPQIVTAPAATSGPRTGLGDATGLLYLENTLTSSAFTPDRTAVLELLAAQAAISLGEYLSLQRSPRTGGEGPAPGRR